MKDINQSQQERLAYIDFRLYFLGLISRGNLVKRFGIREAAATRDLALYKENAGQNLVYDTKEKIYTVTDAFKPLFNFPPDKVLTTLSQGYGGEIVAIHEGLIDTETPSYLSKPDINILAIITRAIHTKRAVKIDYCSLTSGNSKREIVPFCLVDNGLRWHVRAYDRLKGRFSDFVITRMAKPSLIKKTLNNSFELKEADIQWNRIVELELIAHPKIKHKEAIEMDYGMQDGLLELKLRAAIAGYLLKRWNVDCSKRAQLKDREYHLWLRNSAALYGVESAVLAPGYDPKKQK